MTDPEHPDGHPMRRATDVILPDSGLERAWKAIRTQDRRTRFRAWRKTPAVVTRGYLAFRDFIVVGLCVGMVLSGIVAIRDLRRDDCIAANERRGDLRRSALDLVMNDRRLLANDRTLIVLADAQSDNGLPDEFKGPLLAAYDTQEADLDAQVVAIDKAYAPASCPRPSLLPW